MGFIEESINARFQMVKFRLFAEQVNGGVADCCEPMVNGVPYSAGLNRGGCMDAGEM